MKEQIKLYQAERKIQEEKVTPETLLAEGKVSRRVLEKEDKYYMYYALKENAFEGMQGLGKGNLANLKDVFLIDDDFNVKYIASNGKEYGDEIKEKILEDETEIRFTSKAFSEYVSKISGVKEEDLKFKWMKEQTSLTIKDPNITNLEDLIFFPNLRVLKLGEVRMSPQITALDGIENCSKIETLIITGGPDKDYSALKYLENLSSFNREYFQGSDFENAIKGLKYCNKLKKVTFRMAETEVKDMSSIKALKNLTELSLEACKISEIKGLENMLNLSSLNLSLNKISEIRELHKLINLNSLNLSNNKIEDITPLSSNINLMSLNLKGNKEIKGNREAYSEDERKALDKIGEILDREGNIYLDVDKLGIFTNYKSLDLSNQNLTTLEFLREMTQLTSLNLSNNQITLEDETSKEILRNMTNLKTLSLANNKLTNISAINNLKGLVSLNLNSTNVNLVEIEDIISNLNNLKVTNEELKTIINCNPNKITRLKLDNNRDLTGIPNFSVLTNLKELNLRNTGVKDFTSISQIKSLKSLDLSANNLHDKEKIDFSQLINLTNLNLSNNSLWSEDLESLKPLKNNANLVIDLSNNAIVDATSLLEFPSSCRIGLKGNINLSQASKDKLKEKFGNNVTF